MSATLIPLAYSETIFPLSDDHRIEAGVTITRNANLRFAVARPYLLLAVAITRIAVARLLVLIVA